MRKSVVLPAPLRPTKPTRAFAGKATVALSNRSRGPSRYVRSFRWIMARLVARTMREGKRRERAVAPERPPRYKPRTDFPHSGPRSHGDPAHLFHSQARRHP